MLFLKSGLDDLSSRQQSFLQILECLILDHDCTFLIQWLRALEGQLFENGLQVILLALLLLLVSDLGLALLHLISSLLLNRLLEHPLENLLLVLGVILLLLSQLIDALLKVSSVAMLGLPGLLVIFHGRLALLLHKLDGIVKLLLFVHALVFIAVFIVNVFDLALTDYDEAADLIWLTIDLAFLVMVEDLDNSFS